MNFELGRRSATVLGTIAETKHGLLVHVELCQTCAAVLRLVDLHDGFHGLNGRQSSCRSSVHNCLALLHRFCGSGHSHRKRIHILLIRITEADERGSRLRLGAGLRRRRVRTICHSMTHLSTS